MRVEEMIQNLDKALQHPVELLNRGYKAKRYSMMCEAAEKILTLSYTINYLQIKNNSDGEREENLADAHIAKWIPVEQGLPRENQYVRVTIWNGDEQIGRLYRGSWYVCGPNGLTKATVIAWQPTHPYLPKG